MELTKIKSKDVSWGYAAQSLNNNFEKVSADFDKLKNATLRVKGYFSSEEQLKEHYPVAVIGDKAYVRYLGQDQIWLWDGDKWYWTGGYGDGEEVPLGDYYTKEQIDSIIRPYVYDGGRADTNYGGAISINGGNAYQE